MQAASLQQVKGGLVPAALAMEGVRLRYLVDARIDDLLATVHHRITTPPMLANPFGKIVAALHDHAACMEMSQLPPSTQADLVFNVITKATEPGSFVYQGMATGLSGCCVRIRARLQKHAVRTASTLTVATHYCIGIDWDVWQKSAIGKSGTFTQDHPAHGT